MTHIDQATSAAVGMDAAALARLDASIRLDVETGQMLGAAAIVARDGVVVYREAIGMVAPDRPARLDDIYLLMSLSKSFTAVLVLRAIEQGWFTLDTRVDELLPGFGAGGKQAATVRHLLLHSAGVYSGLLPPASLESRHSGDLALGVAAVAGLPAEYVPGSQVLYSPSAGYAVLGQLLVLCDPARRSFREIARQELFLPLGMDDSSFGMPLDAARRVPAAYTPAQANPAGVAVAALLNRLLDADAELPAGGAFGSVDDVFRFAEAMRLHGVFPRGRLLSDAMFELACRSHTGELRNVGWDAYRDLHGLADTPAHYSLLGGQVRGTGHHLSAAGSSASPSAFYSVGRGTTLWLVDPVQRLSFVFLSAGIIEGLPHVQRLSRLSDLALAACLPP